MWSPIYHGVAPAKLLELVQEVLTREPQAVVVPNKVANLAIVKPDPEEGWLFIGYIDMNNESIDWMEADSIMPFDPRAAHPATRPLPP
jgi:hypothetical protein